MCRIRSLVAAYILSQNRGKQNSVKRISQNVHKRICDRDIMSRGKDKVKKTNRLLRILTIMLIATALTFTGMVPSFAASGKDDVPGISGTSAILIDAGSGDVLYEKNSHQQRDPASITKILNCMVVLDTLDFDREVTIDFEPVAEGSTIKLKKGEKIKVKDLVYGMMLFSGNDAAQVLGYTAGNGDMDAFCEKMNEKAKECGALDTVYTNPNGLNDKSVNNVTTAYDIAMVSRQAMKDPRFREIVSTARYVIPKTNKHKARKLKNSNRCLWDTKTKVKIDGRKTPLKYEGCKGIKTGYSSTAGDCFAGYVKKGNTELISVVLNAVHEEEKFQDTINIWNYGFANYKSYTVAKAGEVQYELNVRRGDKGEVDLGTFDAMKITVDRNAQPEETVTAEIEPAEDKITAPVKKGTVLAQAVIYDNGKEIARRDLVALENVEEGGPLSYIGIADEDVPGFVVLLILALITLFVIRVLWVKKKRASRTGKKRKPAKKKAAKTRNKKAKPKKKRSEAFKEKKETEEIEIQKYGRNGTRR